jgi:ERCC4-related helicase
VCLVNTVQLAQQHAESIEDILEVRVGCWTSDTKKKSWHKERFRVEFESHDVIVATAQLFVDAIKHSFVSIAEINVLILDECHHARVNHPFHELMKQFQYANRDKLPRIIGLSGMLTGISSSVTSDNVEDELRALEATLLSKIVTVRHMQEYKNVLLYSTNPNERYIRYNTIQDDSDIIEDLIEKIDNIRWELSLVRVPGMQEINPKTLNPRKSRKLKEISNLFEGVKLQLESMGLYAGYLGIKAIKVQYGLILKKPEQKAEFLNEVKRCLAFADELLSMMAKFDFEKHTAEKIYYNSTAKVQKLINLLKSQFNNPNRVKDLQSLIFATQRSVTKCLYHLLKRYAEVDADFPIIADFVVGINSEIPESIDEVTNVNNNKDALIKFRKKEVNVIVTTSVLEEGIDLQMCNLVIMFDHPTTFRAYVQSKGRARVRDSMYIVLVTDDEADRFVSQRDKFDELDLTLKKILLTKACDEEINPEDIEKEQAEMWEPFFTNQRAMVNNLSAVSLLNRFVSRYTNTNGLFKVKNIF